MLYLDHWEQSLMDVDRRLSVFILLPMFSSQNVKIVSQLSLGGHTLLMDYFIHVKSTGKPPVLIEVKMSDVSPLLSSPILTKLLRKVQILAE